MCDGIFLNYTWTVHHLFRSKAAAGQPRQKDVYVGVDCFDLDVSVKADGTHIR